MIALEAQASLWSRGYDKLVRDLSDDALRRLRNDLTDKHDAHRLRRVTHKVERVPFALRELLTAVNAEWIRREAGTYLFDDESMRFTRETNTVHVSEHDKLVARTRYRADRRANPDIRHDKRVHLVHYPSTRTAVTVTPAIARARAMGAELDVALRQHRPLTRVRWTRDGYTRT